MSTEHPKFSFCMTTFKRPELLQSTLRSILAQTVGDFEVIISDNDPEGSAQVAVESLQDERLKYFHNSLNLGMIKSFNKSIEKATGSFVVMITDDDPVYPDMLKTLDDLQKEYPGYGIYLGGCDWFCTSHELGKLYNLKVGTNSCLSNTHDINHKQAYTPNEFLQQLFSFGVFPHYLWSTAIVKREILIKIGGVPDYGTPFLGDYAFLSAVSADSGCVILNRSLGCQTLHQGNFGRNQNEQIITVAENFPIYIEQKASHLSEWPDIKKRMLKFTALWVVSHMSFLHHHYKKTHDSDNSLKEAEKSVFKIGSVRKYKTKYYIKKNFPGLHDILVKLKKRVSG